MEPDSQTIESIFDIIYLDRPRVESYFAQLFPEGTLTAIKSSISEGDNSRQDIHLSLGVVKGQMQDSMIASKTLERQYDAAWTLPITLANRLDEQGFLYRDLETAPLGQLILLSGGLQIVDIRMLKDMWEPLARFLAPENPPQNNRHQQRAAEKAPSPPEMPPGSEFDEKVASLMRLVPHALQLNFCAGENLVWSTLEPAMMAVTAEDFALKHGTIVPGEWHMIAVLDRRPDHKENEMAHEQMLLSALEQAEADLTFGVMELLDQLRGLVGRPSVAYGATPIMIFRALKLNNA